MRKDSKTLTLPAQIPVREQLTPIDSKELTKILLKIVELLQEIKSELNFGSRFKGD